MMLRMVPQSIASSTSSAGTIAVGIFGLAVGPILFAFYERLPWSATRRGPFHGRLEDFRRSVHVMQKYVIPAFLVVGGIVIVLIGAT